MAHVHHCDVEGCEDIVCYDEVLASEFRTRRREAKREGYALAIRDLQKLAESHRKHSKDEAASHIWVEIHSEWAERVDQIVDYLQVHKEWVK